MKLCIIGLPQAGKTTVFAALTGARGEKDSPGGSRSDTRIGTVTVFDERIDFLSEMYQPKKTTHARIEYFLPADIRSSPGAHTDGGFLAQARACDALVHVVRNFENRATSPAVPEKDFLQLEEEMILNDLMVVEKRMERLNHDMKRGKKPDEREMSLLVSCKELLETGKALRTDPVLADDPALKGFTFLSGKPEFILINNDDEDETPPLWNRKPDMVSLVVRGRLEMDIASMTNEEAREFIEAYHIGESALDRVIGRSYRVLNRISFFTVGPDEVRAWPITAGTPALEAAGEVHSDISKGFIRAEVVAYEDLKSLGGFQEAKKSGLVRLEGKGYVVKDGDIINYRFNVQRLLRGNRKLITVHNVERFFMEKIKVGIVGAGGYGGCGAIELLHNHPHAEIRALLDKQDVGKPISDLYPHLKGFCDMLVTDPDDEDCPDDFDVVFFATPDGVGQSVAPSWIKKGAKVVDYSGDFRFNDLETYRGYATRIGRTQEHLSPEMLTRSVYGLAELHRKEIADSSLVGNPGCFAVSCILGLSPALKSGLIEPESIICDAKTGVSGAGKKPGATFHYPARYDAMNAYRISGHQHVYEIERELGVIAGSDFKITFTPHVIPLARGILTTIYAELREGMGIGDIESAYRSFYSHDRFVRVFGPETPQVSTNVRGSNFCNLSLNVDERTGKLIVVSLIDNLVKGQAGSAVQNMNIMFGMDETAGLMHPGIYP